MAQVTGRAKVTIGGTFVDTFKGVTLNTGGTKRNTVTTSSRVHYSEELTPAHLEIERAFVKGSSMKDFDFADETVQVQYDTGQTYVIPHAFRTDPTDLTDDGKNKIVIEGDPAQEIL